MRRVADADTRTNPPTAAATDGNGAHARSTSRPQEDGVATDGDGRWDRAPPRPRHPPSMTGDIARLTRCRYLAFGAGAFKGVALVAALRALDGVDRVAPGSDGRGLFARIKGAAGTSIGSAIALAAVCRMPIERLAAVARDPKTWSLDGALADADILRLVERRGLCSHDVLYRTIHHFMDTMGLPRDIDLAALHARTGRVFVCNATDADDLTPVYLSHTTAPHMRVADALCASMCVPGLVEPFEWCGRSLVDGAWWPTTFPTCFPKTSPWASPSRRASRAPRTSPRRPTRPLDRSAAAQRPGAPVMGAHSTRAPTAWPGRWVSCRASAIWPMRRAPVACGARRDRLRDAPAAPHGVALPRDQRRHCGHVGLWQARHGGLSLARGLCHVRPGLCGDRGAGARAQSSPMRRGRGSGPNPSLAVPVFSVPLSPLSFSF
ncbi:patatin-like phospholipase [Pandoravirus inopinatum]|uniref:Patatin-like phospholipase n=1 Tax=Pandoravirus inopinatum TaxID=1605721 RepID=A0A0B5IZ20_9VIRU|nr:patatin-like phospholipase [Pandoravirus inopinatum]AJF98128.1 patatin-like phospholipase [Pandoravirus inopinatum]